MDKTLVQEAVEEYLRKKGYTTEQLTDRMRAIAQTAIADMPEENYGLEVSYETVLPDVATDEIELVYETSPKKNQEDPLKLVCGVSEYMKDHDMNQMAVLRGLRSGKIVGKKSCGVWIIRKGK